MLMKLPFPGLFRTNRNVVIKSSFLCQEYKERQWGGFIMSNKTTNLLDVCYKVKGTVTEILAKLKKL